MIKGCYLLLLVLLLSFYMDQKVRAQYPSGSYYTPAQQAQPPAGTATPAPPAAATQPGYQQPAQPVYQQPAQPVYQQQPGYQSPEGLQGYPATASAYEPEPALGKKKSDHERAVNEIGLGLLGIIDMPIVAAELDETNSFYFANLRGDAELAAPTIGVRYWFNETVGIQGGLGLGFSEGAIERVAGGVTTKADSPSYMAFTVHAGVPLALIYSGHFVFEVVPLIDAGLSTGTVYGLTPESNTDVSSLLLRVGARVGAEIHFGFIGIEQLALQTSLGLQLSYLSKSLSYPGVEENASELTIGTTAGNSPWDLFTKNISAIYYIY